MPLSLGVGEEGGEQLESLESLRAPVPEKIEKTDAMKLLDWFESVELLDELLDSSSDLFLND